MKLAQDKFDFFVFNYETKTATGILFCGDTKMGRGYEIHRIDYTTGYEDKKMVWLE